MTNEDVIKELESLGFVNSDGDPKNAPFEYSDASSALFFFFVNNDSWRWRYAFNSFNGFTYYSDDGES